MKKGKTFRVELRQHQTKDVDADMAHVDASGTLTFSYGIRHPAILFFPSRTTYHPFAWISRGVWINCIEIAE